MRFDHMLASLVPRLMERELGIHCWRMRQIFREFCKYDDAIKCIVRRLSSECSYRYGSLKFFRRSLYFCQNVDQDTQLASLWLTDMPKRVEIRDAHPRSMDFLMKTLVIATTETTQQDLGSHAICAVLK